MQKLFAYLGFAMVWLVACNHGTDQLRIAPRHQAWKNDHVRKLLLISIALIFCGFMPLHDASATYFYPDTGDYGGGGVPAGVNAAGPNFGTSSNLRTVIMRILEGVFLLLGIITVIVIIIAGIYLMVGGGNDESRSKAVKMIMYALIGLILILLAGAIVRFAATIFN